MFNPTIAFGIPSNPEELRKSESLGDKDAQKLKENCAEMESLFVYYLLKEMRETVPKEGLFSGGKGEEMYSSVLDLELAREIASKRGLGISTMLFEQLSSSNSISPEAKKGAAKGG